MLFEVHEGQAADAMVVINSGEADIESNEESEIAAGRQREIDKMMEFGLGECIPASEAKDYVKLKAGWF